MPIRKHMSYSTRVSRYFPEVAVFPSSNDDHAVGYEVKLARVYIYIMLLPGP